MHVTKIRCVLLSVTDPDLQMSGGGRGRGCVPKNFRPFGPQFGIKLSWGGVGGGGAGAGALLDRPLDVLGKFGAELIT